MGRSVLFGMVVDALLRVTHPTLVFGDLLWDHTCLAICQTRQEAKLRMTVEKAA
jgi:hypothetical protein